MTEETFRTTVRALFRERFGAEADRLDAAIDGRLQATITAAYPELGAERADDVAFHLADWRADAAFLLALALAPERFTAEEVRTGLDAFLIHAPNHVVAAAKLAGWPAADIFDIGALDGPAER